MKDPLSDILERRETLIERALAYPKDVRNLLPVKIEEVNDELSKIDTVAVINGLEVDLSKSIKELGGKHYEALEYEWYYGGKDSFDQVTLGMAAEKCAVKGLANTDMVKISGKPGLEREEPEFSGAILDEISGFSIIDVLGPWYKNLDRRYDHFDYSRILNTPTHSLINESSYLYHELFMLKLFELNNFAYKRISLEKPRYVFCELHDRWPVLIYGQ